MKGRPPTWSTGYAIKWVSDYMDYMQDAHMHHCLPAKPQSGEAKWQLLGGELGWWEGESHRFLCKESIPFFSMQGASHRFLQL